MPPFVRGAHHWYDRGVSACIKALTKWRCTPWLDEEGIIGVALQPTMSKKDVERVLLFDEMRTATCGHDKMRQPPRGGAAAIGDVAPQQHG